MSFVPDGLIEQARQEGADRERRRIRRAQRDALRNLYSTRDFLPTFAEARTALTLNLVDIDAATRAPRKGKRK